MAISSEDLIVLTVAMVQKYGITDTMQIEGTWIDKTRERILEEGKGYVALAFTGDPQGKYINITCIFSQTQRDEWAKMGMTSKGKMGEA